MTHNQLDYWGKVEQARSNRATESLRAAELSETMRKNRAGEAISMRGQDVVSATADRDRASREQVASLDRSVRQSELAESIRTHLANENINQQRVNTDRYSATYGSYADRTRAQLYGRQGDYYSATADQGYGRLSLEESKLNQDIILAEMERDLRRELKNRDIEQRQIELLVNSLVSIVNRSGGVFNFFNTLTGGNIPVE